MTRYDPWRHLAEHWPEVIVVVEPMAGRLLGQLRYPVIALRAGTSAAQRRSTLTHELVHLERGVADCGPFAAREEAQVDRVAAALLITVDELAAVLRLVGPAPALAPVAAALDVDRATLRTRLAHLTPVECARLTRHRDDELWRVA